MACRRVLIDAFPDWTLEDADNPFQKGQWPVHWLKPPMGSAVPFMAMYRLKLNLNDALSTQIMVTADERYEFYVDGELIGRGSERGDLEHWYIESYQLDLQPGDHTIAARVWALGDKAPLAQFSCWPGFLLACEPAYHKLLATGHANWQVKPLTGYAFTSPTYAFGVGWNVELHGASMQSDEQLFAGDDWQPAAAGAGAIDYRRVSRGDHVAKLRPARLPAMVSQDITGMKVRFAQQVDSRELEDQSIEVLNHDAAFAEQFQASLDKGHPLEIPAGERWRCIVDLGNYYCAYTQCRAQGKGGYIRLLWAETLYLSPEIKHDRNKGNRDEIDGKYFTGIGDIFHMTGESRSFRPMWWQAGRYVEVLLESGDEPLVVESLTFEETRYPLEDESQFESDDARISQIWPVMFRTLQMCSHETYMDCPYYEQLMYVGDTRMEVLTTYVTSHDHSLPEKAIDLFAASRRLSGLTTSRYPCRGEQIIPGFSLWWIGMVYDFVLWTGRTDRLADWMPIVHGVLDAFTNLINEQNIIKAPLGWNYMDWVDSPDWQRGLHPGGMTEPSGLYLWQFIYTLKLASALERLRGCEDLAKHNDTLASRLAEGATRAYFDQSRGLYADTLNHQSFSEHTNCLALLSGCLPEQVDSGDLAARLFNDPGLHRTTIYFSHYLFETAYLCNRTDIIRDRLSLWYDHIDKGMRTTIEAPEPTRSDCHAWGAHPIYHSFASLAGIRPCKLGSSEVIIQPRPADLKQLRGSLPYRGSEIAFDFTFGDKTLAGHVAMPPDVTGQLIWGDAASALKSGRQQLHLESN